MVQVKFKKLTETAKPFSYSREGDACMDVCADESTILMPNETKVINTGIALEIPEGHEGIIRGRSGLALNKIVVHVGTIDSNYRGNVGVIMTNLNSTMYPIYKGQRIAQFSLQPVMHVQLAETDTLSETDRGDNGYGSSGL